MGSLYGCFQPKIGGKKPPKWMVNILVENPIKHGMIWGVKTHIFGNIHMMKVFKSVLHLRMS